MRMSFFFLLTVLLITNMIPFVGCSRDSQIIEDMFPHDPEEGVWVIEEMPIYNLEILISESRPAQVTVKATGEFRNTCVSVHETHQTREGNTINIQITWSREGGGLICGQAVTEVQEEVSIGTFGVGEYTVIVNGIRQVFRIE